MLTYRYFCFPAAILLLGLLAAGCATDGDSSAPDLGLEAADLANQIETARQQGDFGRALALADSLSRRPDAAAHAHFLRGDILTDLNYFDSARVAFEKVLKLDDQYSGARFKLGHNAFLRQQYSEAIGNYQRERALMRRGAPRRDGGSISRDLATVSAQIGRSYALLGKSDSARFYYEDALAHDTLNASAAVWRGRMYEEEGDYEQAVALYRRAVAREPQDPDYRFRLGSALLAAGRAEEAAGILGSVLQQRPAHEGANYQLAQALMRMGRSEDAEPLLARADTLKALYMELAQAEAGAYQQPERPERWLDLARLLLMTGRYEEAQRAFSAASYLDPTNLAIQNDMANLSLSRGDTLGAIKRFEAVLEQDSTFADAWLNLGVVYAVAGEYDAARWAWEKTTEIDPEHPEAKANLRRLQEMD